MRKREKLDDYEVFYMELPQADYMDDIEIQYEHDDSTDQVQGLSDHQVSEIARDSLNAAQDAEKPSAQEDKPSPNQS